jgi:3D-(3,5/4)-trihydroxycyclohexane-1,2-dione acylhydrolase (decyclizing)
MEVGFSCMGGEIPAALGVRLARPDAGEIFVVIGDGTYLMHNTELVTAVQEGLKITVLLIVNGGYQSIHALQRRTTARSFGLEFRRREPDGALAGPTVEVDWAANARSLGCTVFEADDLDAVQEALARARAAAGPAVVVARTEPLRLLLDSECWWDVGVPAAAARPETREAAARLIEGRAGQRFHH